MISLLDDIDSGVIRLLDFIKFGPVPVRIVDLPLEVKVKGLRKPCTVKRNQKKLDDKEKESEARAKEKQARTHRRHLVERLNFLVAVLVHYSAEKDWET